MWHSSFWWTLIFYLKIFINTRWYNVVDDNWCQQVLTTFFSEWHIKCILPDSIFPVGAVFISLDSKVAFKELSSVQWGMCNILKIIFKNDWMVVIEESLFILVPYTMQFMMQVTFKESVISIILISFSFRFRESLPCLNFMFFKNKSIDMQLQRMCISQSEGLISLRDVLYYGEDAEAFCACLIVFLLFKFFLPYYY